MPVQLVRFADLKKRGVARSWAQLKRMQEDYGFPLGRMLTPNVRIWTEDEIEKYLDSRPVENDRPLQGAPRIRHERRQAGQTLRDALAIGKPAA